MLLPDSVEIALRLEKGSKKTIYVLADSSYGSCCVDEITAQHVNADGILHFGHACLNPTGRLPVLHILPKSEFNVKLFCDKFSRYFSKEDDKILLFYDVSLAWVMGKDSYIYKNKFHTLKKIAYYLYYYRNCLRYVETEL